MCAMIHFLPPPTSRRRLIVPMFRQQRYHPLRADPSVWSRAFFPARVHSQGGLSATLPFGRFNPRAIGLLQSNQTGDRDASAAACVLRAGLPRGASGRHQCRIPAPPPFRGENHGQEDASTPDARPARKRSLAEFRHRPEAAGQGQGLHGRPDGSAGAFLRNAQGLLERRHGRRLRLRRRRDPALHRSQGRERQAGVPGRGRVPHAARHAAGRHALQHRRAAQAVRHLGKARLGPDRLPRPVGRHHVPGRDQRERAEGLRRDQRARLRPRRRRARGAHRRCPASARRAASSPATTRPRRTAR